MKKIINGKKYDTETAKAIGKYIYGEGSRDFRHFSEILYKKKNGEYFLYGEGGPLSKYAVSEGVNSWSGGEMIIPCSFDEAREWGEKNLDSDKFEVEFGEVSEDDTTEFLSVSLPASTSAKLRRLAAKEGKTISGFIRDLVEDLYRD